MKTYNQFGEFLFLRDTLVTYLVVHHQSPIQDILSLERVDGPVDCPWFEDGGITISRLASDYSRLCRNLLPDCLLLFPTDNGSPLKKHKYIKHVNTLLREAGGKPINLSDPITTKHLAQLLSLRFYYQRQRYQIALALGFLGHNALRPGEIACMRVRDVDLDQETVRLVMPKAGRSQFIPIPPEMLEPLGRYVENLRSDDYLFIHPNGTPWERRDVHHVTRAVAERLGLRNVYPRRMRPTVAQELKKGGASLDEVRAFLRHRDERTTGLYYAPDDVDSCRATYQRCHPLAQGDR